MVMKISMHSSGKSLHFGSRHPGSCPDATHVVSFHLQGLFSFSALTKAAKMYLRLQALLKPLLLRPYH